MKSNTDKLEALANSGKLTINRMIFSKKISNRALLKAPSGRCVEVCLDDESHKLVLRVKRDVEEGTVINTFVLGAKRWGL